MTTPTDHPPGTAHLRKSKVTIESDDRKRRSKVTVAQHRPHPGSARDCVTRRFEGLRKTSSAPRPPTSDLKEPNTNGR